ncbi:glycosyltransferase family 2 protein [Aurantibacillus circumpalustris]|uniref:glycosyltransferase family 2 protein n=1 Tax=Aurantibacillus circumpalustris TaxID=3036359 RepID=UPI00295BBC6C|nr:glycosyltransferase [Aurantibacillus circumpalustris]
MTQPLVSICIPVYNGEKYLKQCLDSCINQTYDNYEIIICDDGSTDTSVQLIEEYAISNKKIRLSKNEKNLGLVENWNACIKQARGEWIKFVFQDDYIAENCLQKFVEQIEPSVNLIVSARNFILPENPSSDYINYYTNRVRTLENTGAYSSTFFTPQSISRIAAENISMNFIGEPSLTFFRGRVVDELGSFNPLFKQICDLEFVLRIASKYGLKYIPEKICAFRIHTDSTTSTNVENKYFDLHYIEPLLFSWVLFYSKEYNTFRSCLNVFLKFKLKMYFKLKCYVANKVNREENKNHLVFNPSQTQFKEIHNSKDGNLLVRMIALVKK